MVRLKLLWESELFVKEYFNALYCFPHFLDLGDIS